MTSQRPGKTLFWPLFIDLDPMVLESTLFTSSPWMTTRTFCQKIHLIPFQSLHCIYYMSLDRHGCKQQLDWLEEAYNQGAVILVCCVSCYNITWYIFTTISHYCHSHWLSHSLSFRWCPVTCHPCDGFLRRLHGPRCQRPAAGLWRGSQQT